MAALSFLRRFSPTPCCMRFLSTAQNLKVVKEMSSWTSEKAAIMEMDLDCKRKIYKAKEYLTLDSIETWKDASVKIPASPLTEEDLKEAQHFDINSSLNQIIAQKVSIWKGDITKLEIDAIVNAANSKLLGGGGVDGAIHRAAGPNLKNECATLKGCQTGNAKITGGYCLPAKFVIHTVGPKDGSSAMLTSCYTSCLSLMTSHSLCSVAFPCISTGVYHFPNLRAAHLACRAIRRHLEEHHASTTRVIFCVFEKTDHEIYERIARHYFPVE